MHCSSGISTHESDSQDGLRTMGGRLSVPCPPGTSPYTDSLASTANRPKPHLKLSSNSFRSNANNSHRNVNSSARTVNTSPQVAVPIDSRNTRVSNQRDCRTSPNGWTSPSTKTRNSSGIPGSCGSRSIRTPELMSRHEQQSSQKANFAECDAAISKLLKEADIAWPEDKIDSSCKHNANYSFTGLLNVLERREDIPVYAESDRSESRSDSRLSEDDMYAFPPHPRPLHLDLTVLDELLDLHSAAPKNPSKLHSHTSTSSSNNSVSGSLLNSPDGDIPNFAGGIDFSSLMSAQLQDLICVPPNWTPGTIIEETDSLFGRKYSLGSAGSSESFESSASSIAPDMLAAVTGTSNATFPMPSMQFVWESDPNGKL